MSLSPWPLVSGGLIVLAVSWVATAAVLRWLRRDGIVDRPNERSSHVVPTPRGGGIAIMVVALPAWIVVGLWSAVDQASLAAAVAAGLLAVVSWLDDRAGLSQGVRLIVQLVCVAVGLAALPGAGGVFQGWLPPLLDRGLTALAWLWFINLFNFMDGIDGIAGTEAASIGGGIALLAVLHPATIGEGNAMLAIILAAASLGFLWWNWQPAKLFMGDVGSVPLGFLLGWLLLSVAAAGYWAPALILPLYFLVDATWTLLRRLARGAKIWQAHREHFYQRAVQAGRSHASVVRRVLVANLVLVALAVVAVSGTVLVALAAAAATVGLLLADLSRAPRSPAS